MAGPLGLGRKDVLAQHKDGGRGAAVPDQDSVSGEGSPKGRERTQELSFRVPSSGQSICQFCWVLQKYYPNSHPLF